MERHNRSHFYKYISADVAKLIIENQKLKWSSPQSFNDPFDHKFKFLDVDFEKLKGKFSTALEKLIFESDATIDTSTENGQMLHELQQNRDHLPKKSFYRGLRRSQYKLCRRR